MHLAWLAPLAVAASAGIAQARDAGPSEAPHAVMLSPDEILALAAGAAQAGDAPTAEALYRALFADPSADVRAEARFRLAMLFAGSGRLRQAAILLREILDEQPNAQRVRLEYARVLDLLGDEAGARKALRELQAGSLPPAVVRVVDRYSAALRARKPAGGSFEMAIAPDSNINRASRSDVLGTVLGEFQLDEDAQARSGIGLAARGQAFARLPLSPQAGLLGRLSASANLYGHSDFDDAALGASAGPEFSLGADRLNLELGGQVRWFGWRQYARSANVTVNYLHLLDRRSQLRSTVSAGVVDNRLNPAQDGRSYSASLQYERALSPTTGVGARIALARDDLAAPGYSNVAGQLTLFGYRDLGSSTLVGSISHGRLWADARLPLFLTARNDRTFDASLSLSLRKWKVAGFAPFVKAELQRHASSVELYSFKRARMEVGLERAY